MMMEKNKVLTNTTSEHKPHSEKFTTDERNEERRQKCFEPAKSAIFSLSRESLEEELSRRRGRIILNSNRSVNNVVVNN